MNLTRISCGLFVCCLGYLVGCGPSASTANIGVTRAPRGPNCELTLISPSDVYPGGRYAEEYEMIGIITVEGKVGAQATDPDIKEQVKGKACQLGAELIALTGSATSESKAGIELGQALNFAGYAKKLNSGP